MCFKRFKTYRFFEGILEDVIVDIVALKNNEEIRLLKYKYKEKYGEKLEDELYDCLIGEFRDIIASLMEARRSESLAYNDTAFDQAKDLLKAGVEKWGTDNKVFFNTLVQESIPQLKLTFSAYKQLNKKIDLENDIKGEFSLITEPDERRVLLAVADSVRDPNRYWAYRLHETMKVSCCFPSFNY